MFAVKNHVLFGTVKTDKTLFIVVKRIIKNNEINI